MHEFSAMTSIVDAVSKEARNHQADRVVQVTLEIGALTFLNEEQLRFAFDVLTKDTTLDGAALVIESVSPEVQCSCGYAGDALYEERKEFHMRIPLLQCPLCGELVHIARGRECLIKNIEIEVENVSSAR